MAVVFFHVPRTSGSTVWHTLIRLALASGVEGFDLYHRSEQLFGSPYYSINAAEDLRAAIAAKGPRAIVHHHTNQNITGFLCPEEHKYVTMLRDPADRLISETFHLSAILRANDLGMRDHIRYLDGILSPGFLSKLADPATPPDDLVASAAAEPFYRNYYINAFWQLFFGDPRQDAPGLQPAPETALAAVTFAVANRFHYIGAFAKVDDSVRAIAALAGIGVPADAGIVHIDNGARIPALRPETVALVRALNKADYKFCKRVVAQNANGLARRLAAAQASRPGVEANFAAAERGLASVLRSRSWRLTAPLRKLRNLAFR